MSKGSANESASEGVRNGRDWTPAEQQVIDSTVGHPPRKHKLTREQVKEIRRRTDSLTVPFTVRELALEYGVSDEAIANIARRTHDGWAERANEPENYWRGRPR